MLFIFRLNHFLKNYFSCQLCFACIPISLEQMFYPEIFYHFFRVHSRRKFTETPIKYRSEWTILDIPSAWTCFFANYGVEWPDPFQDTSQLCLWPTVNLRNVLSRYGSKLCACKNGSSLNETIPLTIACGSSAHHVIDCDGSAWEAFEPCAKLKNKEGLFVYVSGRMCFPKKAVFMHDVNICRQVASTDGCYALNSRTKNQ